MAHRTRQRAGTGAAAALVLAGALVVAGERPATAQNCEAPSTTADMMTCADADFTAADKALNETYQAVMVTLRKADSDAGDGGDRAGKLRAAQRDWIKLRDADCSLEAAAAFGGTMAPVLETGCRADKTKQRTAYLKTLQGQFE